MAFYLVINAGSSSIKFAMLERAGTGRAGADLIQLYRGKIEGLGGGKPRFRAVDRTGAVAGEAGWDEAEGFDHARGTRFLLDWIEARRDHRPLAAVGHRVVHGGLAHAGPVLIDDEVIAGLAALEPLAPLHQPHNLAPIRFLRAHAPDLAQVASFDTAFHRGQPELAQLFALPQDVTAMGVRRYGFHGLSYEYIAGALAAIAPDVARGRVIVAHLGSGASLCAMADGRSVASTMGFSALDGLPMGTRCGAIDPAVIFWLMRERGLGPADVETLLYQRSGLLGVSGLSNDMRRLRAAAAEGHAGARKAIDLFVYRCVREMGSLAAALGGLDAIVFTAGIGENDPESRAEILAGMAWAGFRLDAAANAAGGPCITAPGGPTAWIIPTNEELMIGRETAALVPA